MAHTFIGGVHIVHGRNPAKERPAIPLEAPQQVVIPMSLHIGRPCTPCVAVGDKVALGQKIGETAAPVGAPIHASVSGTVAAIEPRLTSLGTWVTSVIIDNDGLDTPADTMIPCTAEEQKDPETLARVIRECGIVGMGGATFPTGFKITSGKGKVDTVIINGSECEPFLFSDHSVMLFHPAEVLRGIQLVCRACEVEKATLVVENNKDDAVAALRAVLPADGSVELKAVPTRYPQGAEKQLVHTVTGREVPPGGLPSAVGCNIFNVETCYAVYEAVTLGKPLIGRTLTVTGSCIAQPTAFVARVGTPIGYVFEKAGGFTKEPKKLVMGGPMMGMAQYDLSVPVNKGTNGLLALDGSEDKTDEEAQCIRCGRCVEGCPMRLLPTYLYMFSQKNDLDALEKYHVTDCIECGVCTYNCPARLFLTHTFKASKARLAQRAAERKARAEMEAAAAAQGKGENK